MALQQQNDVSSKTVTLMPKLGPYLVPVPYKKAQAHLLKNIYQFWSTFSGALERVPLQML